MTATLSADSVKIKKGLNYQNVTIIHIEKGEIHYQSSAGILVKKPLREIEMISLERVRELGAAEQDRLRNRHSSALGKYKTARGKIRSNPKGVEDWVDYQMMTIHDATGNGNMAIRIYLDLAKKRADEFFLEILPGRSIDNINKSQQKELLSKIASLLKRERSSAGKTRLKELKESLADLEFPDQSSQSNNQVVTKAPENTQSNLPRRRKSQVFFPRAMDSFDRDEITNSLRRGELDNVIKLATEKLKAESVDHPSMRILQMGLAQKTQAMKKTGEARSKALKDSAITLMYIPTYYGTNADWVGAAFMELGLIHIELKSYDQANRLLVDAKAYVNPAKEPELFDRIKKAHEQIKNK